MKEKFVEVKLSDVVSLTTLYGRMPALLLEDQKERVLPVIIGGEVAFSLKSTMEGKEEEIKDIWAIVSEIISKIGIEIIEASIYDIKDNRFLCRLKMKISGKDVSLDCKPSDAISLAYRSNSPIFVKTEIMDELSVNKKQLTPSDVEK